MASQILLRTTVIYLWYPSYNITLYSYVAYTPSIANPPIYDKIVQSAGYVFCFVFPWSLYHRGCYITPFGGTSENSTRLQSDHPRWTPASTTRTGMDTGTSMEATAAPHQSSGPIEPAAPTTGTSCCRASNEDHVFFSGFTPLYGNSHCSCRGSSPDHTDSSSRIASHFDCHKRRDDVAR